MGHCNDGELESCQVPFPVVAVTAAKTCQNSFSEHEDKGHGTTCVHGAAWILLHFNNLSLPHTSPASPGTV